MLDREQVIWAYRCFFGREPENEQVIEVHRRYQSWSNLREAFVNSPEFNYSPSGTSGSGRFALAPPVHVELPDSPEQLQLMFDHVAASWAKLGSEEPHWSVVTSDNFKSDRIAETEREFYASGNGDVQLIRAFFERNQREFTALERCLEFGCGVGRATSAISTLFPKVYGVDISAPHLKLAKSWFDQNDVSNVELIQLHRVEDIARLPEFDFLYSTIVFQHNPPPVIAYILDTLFSRLKPDGYVLFQVPTYRAGYGFSVNSYLKDTAPGMEMHILPQKIIFELFWKHGISLIEIQEDSLTGSEAFLSQTFFGHRRAEPMVAARNRSA